MTLTRKLLTGNGAAAWAVRLAQVDYIPAFPITPQTEIIETLSRWIDNGDMPGKLITMESEHSMITAAGAAAATGVRVFTATSSQGLLYGMEMIYTVAGWRVPFVLVNVSRALASPITLEPDHNDVLAARDSGFLQIHCATCQEVLDMTIMAYKLSEDARVRLPVIVNEDGFYLSFTREPVVIPDAVKVKDFIGDFDPENMQFRSSMPTSQAVAVLGGSPYSYFRYESHLAAEKALAVFDEICNEFEQRFDRKYDALESYHVDDADYVIFMVGCFATKAKAAVDSLRKAGWKIGLLRPRLLRPYPGDKIRQMLTGKKGVAVVDQNLSMGKGGILYSELTSVLYGDKEAPPILISFIGGLGGRDISPEEFFEIAKQLKQATETNEILAPRLLYTIDELRQIRKLQAIAHVERNTLNSNHQNPDSHE